MEFNLAKMSGYFGEYGGRYVDESLVSTLEDIETFFKECVNDDIFWEEFYDLLKNFVGRPTPLLFAENTTKALGGANIYNINNAIGQALFSEIHGESSYNCINWCWSTWCSNSLCLCKTRTRLRNIYG